MTRKDGRVTTAPGQEDGWLVAEWVNGLLSGQMSGWMNGQVDRWVDGWIDV